MTKDRCDRVTYYTSKYSPLALQEENFPRTKETKYLVLDLAEGVRMAWPVEDAPDPITSFDVEHPWMEWDDGKSSLTKSFLPDVREVLFQGYIWKCTWNSETHINTWRRMRDATPAEIAADEAMRKHFWGY